MGARTAILATLGIDSSRISGDMANAQGRVAAGARGMEKSLSGIGGALGLSLGPTAIAAAGVAALAKGAQYANDLSDAANNAGVSMGFLREVQVRFATEGGKAEQAAAALFKLRDAAADAARVGGPSAAAFSRLGVSVSDTEGKVRPTEELYREVSKALSEMTDKAQAASMAQELFGKSSRETFAAITGAPIEGTALDTELLGSAADAWQKLSVVMERTKGAVGTGLGALVQLVNGDLARKVADRMRGNDIVSPRQYIIFETEQERVARLLRETAGAAQLARDKNAALFTTLQTRITGPTGPEEEAIRFARSAAGVDELTAAFRSLLSARENLNIEQDFGSKVLSEAEAKALLDRMKTVDAAIKATGAEMDRALAQQAQKEKQWASAMTGALSEYDEYRRKQAFEKLSDSDKYIDAKTREIAAEREWQQALAAGDAAAARSAQSRLATAQSELSGIQSADPAQYTRKVKDMAGVTHIVQEAPTGVLTPERKAQLDAQVAARVAPLQSDTALQIERNRDFIKASQQSSDSLKRIDENINRLVN